MAAGAPSLCRYEGARTEEAIIDAVNAAAAAAAPAAAEAKDEL